MLSLLESNGVLFEGTIQWSATQPNDVVTEATMSEVNSLLAFERGFVLYNTEVCKKLENAGDITFRARFQKGNRIIGNVPYVYTFVDKGGKSNAWPITPSSRVPLIDG